MPKKNQKNPKKPSAKVRKRKSTTSHNRKEKAMPPAPILLVPGASATGRDFLLSQLLNNTDIIGRELGFRKPATISVAQKITDRQPRPGESANDGMKLCVSEEEFTDRIDQGDVFASYTLESNGRRYGYHTHAFGSNGKQNGNRPHVIMADASVYQLPDLKQRFGKMVYTVAMIATRAYREENLKGRGSETPEEVEERLNLGDAHVALLIMMGGNPTISYRNYVDHGMAALIDELLEATRSRKSRPRLEAALQAYTGSSNVVETVKRLALDHKQYVDELVILGPEHRVSGDQPIIETPFFKTGIDMIRKAIGETAK